VRTLPILLLALGCRPAPDAPSFDGGGGDAWTFDKRVTGTAPAACDEVRVRSPRGEVVAARQGEAWSAVVPLVAGDQSIEAVCVAGKKESVSEPQPWRVRLADRPSARARVAIADEGLRLDAGGTSLSPVRAAPIVSVKWTARAGNPGPIETADGQALADGVSAAEIVVATPGRDGRYVVDVEVTDADGVVDRSAAAFRVGYGEPLVIDPTAEEPPWVQEAVVYGVVPFFFGERGYADVAARMDELEALGVTVLWFSPITGTTESDFGYAVTDWFTLRETFGTMEEFDALVADAHSRGMKVMMDFVPNHTSDQHPYYQQAGQPGSPYYEYYDRDESGEATFYFGWENLRNLNYDNPEVQAMMIEAFSYWVREHDVDGFRADAAWGPKDRAPEFWPRWREELTRVDPDLFLLAEAGARDPYWFDQGFDVAYDWTWELGDWTWDDAFEEPERTVPLLEAALTNEGEGFHDDALVLRFLNNNDTGERFVTRYGVERVPVAATLMMTAPGVPVVYTGDEVGAEFEPYDEGPVLTWEDPHGLRPLYTKLVAMRKEHGALSSRGFRLVELPGDDVLAYLRTADDGGDDVLVLLNFSEAAADADIPLRDLAEEAESGRLKDLYSGEEIGVEGSISVTLPPLTPMVLTRP
jgi:cyclomaltodextrinase